jgi:hypothetical protein
VTWQTINLLVIDLIFFVVIPGLAAFAVWGVPEDYRRPDV